MNLRQFGELLAQQLAARAGVFVDVDEAQSDLLGRLKRDTAYPRDVIDLFHDLRRAGNEAVHQQRGDHATALAGLKVARQLAVWFHRTFGDRNFRAGPFEPPRPPPDPTAALQDELARLRIEQMSSLSAAESAARTAMEANEARRSAEERAQVQAQERAVWEALASETEARLLALQEELARVQAAAIAQPAKLQFIVGAAAEAAQAIDLDEQATRSLIDGRLRARGWEADTPTLRHAAGSRPVAGRNRAIAEWPAATGPADYVLFVGMMCVGVVEAKRSRKNVAAAIDQAGRYSQGFLPEPGILLPPGGPWPAQSGEGAEAPYRVPLLFATNGRAYLKQLEAQSGIWHRDARNPSNRRRALVDWPTPDGLKAMLDIDRAAASAALAALPFDFAFGLRDYQMRAIQAVEAALADDGQRALLLAMATGTGKTKLAVALLYRLLHTQRFRRVCFVVDRTALGDQAEDAFTSTRIVSARSFADIFGLKVLGDTTPDPATKVHICTIQGLVKRVLFASTPEEVPPVDQYDLMLVDECHRGYTLDREMSDAELGFRSEADYVSKYRRVDRALRRGPRRSDGDAGAAHDRDLRPPDLHLRPARGGDRWLAGGPGTADPDRDGAVPRRHPLPGRRGAAAAGSAHRHARPNHGAGRSRLRGRELQSPGRHQRVHEGHLRAACLAHRPLRAWQDADLRCLGRSCRHGGGGTRLRYGGPTRPAGRGVDPQDHRQHRPARADDPALPQ